MTGATAEPLLLRQNDRDELVGLTRSSSVGAGLAARARIVLLAAEGTPNVEIARLVGVSRPTVNAWRTRYAERGLPGLADEQRSGRKRSIDQRRIVAETLRPPPAGLGVTHWSSRLLADRLGTSHVTVAAAWKRYGVKPWKAETFKFSTDPELEAKVTDIIGLYLAPPENAIVLCCDEKSQIQALNRTQKTLPMQPGYAERATTDLYRSAWLDLVLARGQPFGSQLSIGSRCRCCPGRCCPAADGVIPQLEPLAGDFNAPPAVVGPKPADVIEATRKHLMVEIESATNHLVRHRHHFVVIDDLPLAMTLDP